MLYLLDEECLLDLEDISSVVLDSKEMYIAMRIGGDVTISFETRATALEALIKLHEACNQAPRDMLEDKIDTLIAILADEVDLSPQATTDLDSMRRT